MLVKRLLPILSTLAVTPLLSQTAVESRHPDVLTIPVDSEGPAISIGEPAPGRLVLQSLSSYSATEVAHAVYLPTDWSGDRRFPVMIEFLGNGMRVRDNRNIGYALTGGKGFIWVVLPIVSADGRKDMDWWWGDVAATVAYAKEAVPAICQKWGGNPAQVILTGYSRGAIACNYIGLHDDEIARLWRAIIPISHYDDAHTAWGMTHEEQSRAPERLRRLGTRPQLICGEYSSRSTRGGDARLLALIRDRNLTAFSVAKADLGLLPLTELEGTRKFIAQHHPQGNFTIIDSAWVNHGPAVLHRNTSERQQIRDWIQRTLSDPPARQPSSQGK